MPDDRPWRVEYHRDVLRVIAKNGGVNSPAFVPTIRELEDALATNPKQFEKKRGKLQVARATHVRFADGVEWVAVFRIFEDRRTVRWLSLGPHDRAYDDAQKRI